MRETDYDLLAEQIRALAETDPWYVPLLANAAALLFDAMEDLNWAGFYLLRDGKLVLGPFQGKHACIHIPVGKGVCGTAAERKESVLVPDVHAFPGHIACDSVSRSELVVPLFSSGDLIGVTDLDSPSAGRFSEEDRKGVERIARTLGELLEFP